MTDSRSSGAQELLRSLHLPPGFHAVGLREHKDAFREAQRLAPQEGGGLLAFVHRFDHVEFAVVIEPEETLLGARRALYAAMNALGDVLATFCPPEKPVTFDWPDTVRLDGGIVGGVRLAAPPGTGESDIPDWLVIGVMVRLFGPLFANTVHDLDQPLKEGTSLETEGFDVLDGKDIIESFCRHLLVTADLWQEKGFDPVGRQYLERLERRVGADRLKQRGLDIQGDLVERQGKAINEETRRSLIVALAKPQWIDPETDNPWL